MFVITVVSVGGDVQWRFFLSFFTFLLIFKGGIEGFLFVSYSCVFGLEGIRIEVIFFFIIFLFREGRIGEFLFIYFLLLFFKWFIF